MARPGTSLEYWFWKSLLGSVLATSCRVHVLGREHTARKGPWILASNHISHFDPPLLSGISHRPVDWMAMEELFKNATFAFLLRRVGAFPVSRGKPDRTALRIAGDRIKTKRVLGIFPEGGIRDGEASILNGARPRPGFSLLATVHQVPVIPCVILGSDRLYNPRNWLPLRRTSIWAAFGEPITPTPGSSQEQRRELESALHQSLSSLVGNLMDSYNLSPEDLPKPPAQRMHTA